MGEAILVSSGKGGVGKTNATVNLGVALAAQGNSVALVDGSLTTPDMSLHMGVPFHIRGLSHLLKRKARLESAMFHHKSGATVIPGNIHENLLKEFEGKRFSKLLKQLRKEYDFVLVDCAAGIGRETISGMKHCDKLLVVTNPELPAVVNASKLIQTAKQHKIKPLGVILNRVGRFRTELREKDISPLLHKVPIIGMVSEDRRVSASIKKSEAMVHEHPKSKVSKQFHAIARYLAPQSADEQSGSALTSSLESFFDKVLSVLRE
jgi:septum site-determining protein MinD